MGAALAFAFLGFSQPVSAEEPIEVTLLGDSITDGTVSGDGYGYGALFAASLYGTHAIDNVACSGSTTTDWTLSSGGYVCGEALLPDLIFNEQAIPSLPTDFVTILLGTNDSLGFFEPEPIPPELFRANLEEVIENSLLYGARTVVLLSPPPQCRAAASTLLEAYRDIGIDICTHDPDVLCGVDIYNLLDAGDFVGCDIHPNQQGHLKIATQLSDRILRHTPLNPRMQVFQWLIPQGGGAANAIFPVAVFSTPKFDAPNELDPASFTFGTTGWEESLASVDGAPACLPLDVDGDGLLDAACAFFALASGLDSTSAEAFLRGRSLVGTAVDSMEIGSETELEPLPSHLLEIIEAALQ